MSRNKTIGIDKQFKQFSDEIIHKRSGDLQPLL